MTIKHLIRHELEMGRGFHSLIDDLKYMILLEALKLSDNNKAAAARLLKVHRNNLARWIPKNSTRFAEQLRRKKGRRLIDESRIPNTENPTEKR